MRLQGGTVCRHPITITRLTWSILLYFSFSLIHLIFTAIESESLNIGNVMRGKQKNCWLSLHFVCAYSRLIFGEFASRIHSLNRQKGVRETHNRYAWKLMQRPRWLFMKSVPLLCNYSGHHENLDEIITFWFYGLFPFTRLLEYQEKRHFAVTWKLFFRSLFFRSHALLSIIGKSIIAPPFKTNLWKYLRVRTHVGFIPHVPGLMHV